MRSWWACLVALLLAACADVAPRLDSSPTLGPPVSRFAAEGRLSLRQGDRRDHLRFRWEHAPDGDIVLLMSPLGQGLAELRRNASGATLRQAGQPAVAADSLPRLAHQVFGAALPLEAMTDWMRGARPDLTGEVDGWRVVISDTSPFHQRRLLRVMDARRDDVDFKLIVDDWDLSE